jgi:soluble lytic murein transglycosylase-like protein
MGSRISILGVVAFLALCMRAADAMAPPIALATPVPLVRPAFHEVIEVRPVHAVAAGTLRYASLVEAASRAHGVDADLVHAVIFAESAYDARAVSAAGASGLMQLMPETARRLGVRDVFDPADNIRGGVRHLKFLLDLFDGDVELAVAAYNAGENAVIRAGNRVPPYPQTRKYVPKVIGRYRSLLNSRT